MDRTKMPKRTLEITFVRKRPNGMTPNMMVQPSRHTEVEDFRKRRDNWQNIG
jgi:hypothetical protein